MKRQWNVAGGRWPVMVCAFAAATCFAATTQTWEMSGYQDFSRGQLSGLSLMRDGKLMLGPRLTTVFDTGQAEVWSVARASGGTLYVGTGNAGRLYRVDPSGRSTLLWTSGQPEIFAVAVDSKGAVYAGTSPDGKVYRIENGKATEYFSPAARYIWALAVAPDGALMVGTGDQGKIFRVTAAGQGSVYYDTGQAHVTSLAFDAQGRLLAGSEPNGILYRITAPNKAFVLYDANLPELRSIVAMPDGTVYAAAMGGGVAKQTGAVTAAATSVTSLAPAVSTSITVTGDQAGLNPAPKPQASRPAAAAAQTTVVAQTSTVDENGDRSALYKISPDNTVETLWTSKDENIYDIAPDGSSIAFLTDAQGRIYRLDKDRQATLVAQLNQGDATRLVPSPQGLLAATGNLGRIFRLGNGAAASGHFESPVHDSGTVARWGRLAGRGDIKGIVFQTRSGNSARPDATWSDWSAVRADAGGGAIASPNARYIQWRAEFPASSNATSAPALDDVSIAYLPQNTPPVVRSINVTAAGGKASSATPTVASASTAYSITVTDTADSSAAGAPSQTISRGGGQQIQVAWQADDPDGDHLIYNLYFRGDDETEWKLLRGDMTENTYMLDSDVLADGRYFFRVTASDRPSNPARLAREAELVSAPVVIDNTPPVVTVGAPRRVGPTLEIDVEAQDRAASLRRCEYSVDAGPWSPVEAADGVTDSERESFPLRLAGFPPGEHLIVIRVYDNAGNAGLAKVVVR
jgi:PQQ-like domain